MSLHRCAPHVATLLLALLAASASAEVLHFVEHLEAAPLDGFTAIAESPDGRHLYATGSSGCPASRSSSPIRRGSTSPSSTGT